MATQLTLRSVKGSGLTNTEIDNNFTALRATADGAATPALKTVNGVSLFGSGDIAVSGSALPIATTFAQAIPFDAYRSMGQVIVSGALTFTKNLTGSAIGGETIMTLIADGVNLPNFSACTLAGSVTYNNTAGRINEISFFRTAAGYYYGVLVGAMADVVAPLEVSATAQNAAPTVIEILFDEDMDKALAPPDASTFAVSAGHAAVSTAWGTGNRTVNLTTGTAFVFGEAARTLAYTKNGTRNLKDLAGNEVADFSAKPITNNVAAVDNIAPTLVSAIVQNATPTQVDLVFSEAMNATWSAAGSFTISGHTVSSITRLTATTGYITVSAPFVNGEAARTLGYVQPGTNNMQDLAGNLLANIASASITNNVAAAGSYPTQVGAVTTSPSGGPSIAFPAGIIAGDRIYLFAYGAANSVTAPAFTTYQSGLGNFSFPYALYTRTADGTESGSTASITGSAGYVMFVFRGGNVTTMEEAFAVTAASNTATYNSPSSTSTVNYSLQLQIFVDNQRTTNTVATPPAGATQIDSTLALAGSGLSVALFKNPIATAGASGATTLVWTTGAAYGDTFTFVARGA